VRFNLNQRSTVEYSDTLLENALRRFKRKVQTEDIIKDVKRHSYYLKPGERRRVKQALAQKRARKKTRKDSDQVAPRRVAGAK
jgi:small subunit ribosomal protein S21